MLLGLPQVWMITGDKQETAINIAIACKLVHHPDSLIIINAADSNEAARARLEEALKQCRERSSAGVNGDANGKPVAASVSVAARYYQCWLACGRDRAALSLFRTVCV